MIRIISESASVGVLETSVQVVRERPEMFCVYMINTYVIYICTRGKYQWKFIRNLPYGSNLYAWHQWNVWPRSTGKSSKVMFMYQELIQYTYMYISTICDRNNRVCVYISPERFLIHIALFLASFSSYFFFFFR